MSTLWVVLVGLFLYVALYHLWGKSLQKNLVKADNSRETPAVKFRDDVDFLPTNKFVLFGHHFASIAGAAPIVGPVIALAWGWLPAILWVWFGNVLIGAIHDYLSLMASVRHEGKTIQWVSGKLISQRAGYMFKLFIFFTLLLVIGAFASIIALIFTKNPAVGSASLFFIISAVITGFLLYKARVGLPLGTAIGLLLLLISIWLGILFPIKLAYNLWLLILFIYIIVASSLPVWALLQPRDYLNSYILWGGLLLGGFALIVVSKHINLPAFTMWSAHVIAGKPSPFWPVVPLIIACGSLSGFHSLVASGTTSKQLAKETDALFVGFGGMYTEGFLSTIVIAAVGGFGLIVLKNHGFAFEDTKKFAFLYESSLKSVGGPVGLFALSYAHAVNKALGFSIKVVSIFASLWVSAFALTTLDTTTRIGRFTLSEILEPLGLDNINKWVSSTVVAILGMSLAFGSLWHIIWPAFGGANQMLASIALTTVSVWIFKELEKVALSYKLAVILPAVFLWVTVTSALLWYLFSPLKVLFSKNAFQGILIGIIVVIEIVLNLLLFYDAARGLIKS